MSHSPDRACRHGEHRRGRRQPHGFKRCLDLNAEVLMRDRYDLVVIGAGPAGEKGAAQAAYFGKRVALIERSPYLGGTGINTGTVPSKTLRETAIYFSGL